MAKSVFRKRALEIERAEERGLYSAKRRRRAKRLKYSKQGYLGQHTLSAKPLTHRETKKIDCPATMDLNDNYDATLNTLHDIHTWASSSKGTPVYIDFKSILDISPAAALMMAAELNRWNHLHPQRKLKAIDVELWNPKVRRLLYDMGFFTLLNIQDRALKWDPNVKDGVRIEERFLPFQVGRGSSGAAARRLRDRIETFAGRVKRRYSLYDGLVEAMTNVGQHAYSHKTEVKNWWISASIDKTNRRLTVLCLDHGRGIPKTLPRKHSEAIREIADLLGPGLLKDDARMINAAIDLERSSTRQRHRGHGLRRDIQRYASSHDSSAKLMILSNSGVYLFEHKRLGVESIALENKKISHNGTLIEWVIEDYAEHADESD